ncbi:MAG: transglutaminase-like cysteine peptidase [Phreatobacter sp.]|uniref:transglutaminase-like cysteine peptidase n=1 Tax=Phreatobacter sp. TaxID=1966341 RepID=UPI001A637E09|nr:transglutaminase-like cysteine peptidase [Phreatobacter sp.]MBL8571896.1 transglutaminase-like cysteine peptidase [Phreatobacter sp.]
MRRFASWFFVCAVAAVSGGLSVEASAQQAGRRPVSLPAGAISTPPIGWVQFCSENPADCAQRSASARSLTLTSAAFAQLARVNLAVNREIAQVSDQENFGVEEYWTYPVDGKGDCEDLVLEKKRRLIALGVPREALLITVVRDLAGDGHAILTVVTDRGDYVLDNFTNEVKLWHETGYRFIKRQAQTDPNQWVSLNGGGAGPALVANPAQQPVRR